MLLREPGQRLELVETRVPVPQGDQVLIKVSACAVCRTDLHVVDGELKNPKLPLIVGHQIVGIDRASGKRVGVPWLGWTDGECAYCTTGRENLCDRARFTGYTIDGGYAEYTVADPRFCFPIPEMYNDEEAAPLLCAGLIGFRAYRMIGDAKRVGFYGFGSAAQILAQLAKWEGREVFAFTRPGDTESQKFALEMGAVWAGDAGARQPLDAAIIFAPAGELVVAALQNVAKGGQVICAGIHMSDIPSFPYELLWGERVIRSVANLTRKDGEDFFARVSRTRIHTKRTRFPLENANEALRDLRAGALTGTAVLTIP
jgi:propanol-preferring alcohol dehydrogenase